MRNAKDKSIGVWKECWMNVIKIMYNRGENSTVKTQTEYGFNDAFPEQENGRHTSF